MIDELIKLHELLAMPINLDEEKLGKDIVERAIRVLNVKRLALIVSQDGELKCLARLGFAGDEDAIRHIKKGRTK